MLGNVHLRNTMYCKKHNMPYNGGDTYCDDCDTEDAIDSALQDIINNFSDAIDNIEYFEKHYPFFTKLEAEDIKEKLTELISEIKRIKFND